MLIFLCVKICKLNVENLPHNEEGTFSKWFVTEVALIN